ncbi:cytochrome P450 [Amorphoplanes nipponensis]|uniref:Cytochrome P450 n=1 Tax=Actinoplanes nipponensis TaxID=135950 RepID=A0A919JM50_9ACTN|nr:cytochrome P450 [Actinoplanes nipponensis]GIE51702.1 cytochrome P450 [Actinoplanes nipponensis]
MSLPPKYDAAEMALLDDPYPTYRKLREAGPLCRGGPAQFVVTRYADVAPLINDDRLGAEFSEDYHRIALGEGPLADFFGHVLLNRDPPAHTVLRRLLNPEFTTRAVRERRSKVDSMVEELLAPAVEAGRFDAVSDLADKLPIRVLADFVGLDLENLDEVRPRARELSQAFATYLPESERGETVAALQWMQEKITALFAEKERVPGDDVISRLCDVDPETVSRQSLIDNIVFLLFAGFTTTTDLLANGFAALSTRPDQVALLRADPELATRGVEELLRFDAPVQVKSRMVHEPIEVGGRTIRPGRVLILHLGSANHDEQRFARAHELDLTRRPNPHLSFGGGGIHLCLGAALARAEAASVLTFVSRHFAQVEPDGPVVRRHIPNFRSCLSVPIRIRPA